MDHALLGGIALVFGLSILVILICDRLRVPSVVGFLITGVLCGPSVLGLVPSTHEVDTLAEIGVVLLLFVIGMELSLAELIRLKRAVFAGGGLQVLGTAVPFALLAHFGLGEPWNSSLVYGLLASLSSTAIVLGLLQEKAQMEAPHGRFSLSVLIFQDLMIVPMMLAVPLLAGNGTGAMSGGGAGRQILTLLLGVAGLAVLLLLARPLVPKLLLVVVRSRKREALLLTGLALCFGVGWVAASAGLSLALGAFLAGLLIAESEFSLSSLEGILPFKEVFSSIFFISVGMLLDVSFLAAHLPVVLAATVLVLVLKAILAGATAAALGHSARVAVLAGLALSQVGEFSFVLAREGLAHGILDPVDHQLFLAASIMTMIATPLAMGLAPRLADGLATLPFAWSRRFQPRPGDTPTTAELTDHLLVVGYGLGGRHLVQAAQAAAIPHAVLELNPDTVRTEKAKGLRITHGDASSQAVLEHLGVTRARAMAIVISDPAAVRRVVAVARRLNPSLRIIARTRFLSEMPALLALGADEVIPEEFETSVEMFVRVMAAYLVPWGDIEAFTQRVRAEGYRMLRSPSTAPHTEPDTLCDLRARFADLETAAMTITPDAPLAGRTLAQAALRSRHGLTVIAVRRGEKVMVNPGPEDALEPGDTVYVFGQRGAAAAARGVFEGETKEQRT